MSSTTMEARVSAMRWEADGILSVELRPATAQVHFPSFEAGAHIDLHLDNGLVRSYSLCNPDTDSQRYVVGVLNDRNSRGGSRYVHQQLRVGATLPISAPRNLFQLHADAPRSVLVAGGIGVTPVFCMLQHLIAKGAAVDFIYCARSRPEAAFLEQIQAITNAAAMSLTLHFDQEQGGPPNLQNLLAQRGADSHYYCCGPTPMLDAFEKSCEALGYENVHIERFAAAAPVPTEAGSHGFEVLCAKSKKALQIPAGKSILDALLDAGIHIEHSCKEGVCGSCEAKILEFDGDIEHHDGILSKKERQANKTLMTCVSRCSGSKLVLDV